MLRADSTATPPAAVTVVVPLSVAPAVPVPLTIVTVTLAVEPVAVLPRPSWTATRTAGASALPAWTVVGCPVKASLAATPGVMLKAVLVAPTRPLAVAVNV